MDLLSDFWLSVLASFIGGYAIAFIGVKWIPLLKLKKLGILKVYKNQSHAINSMLNDIGKSNMLYVLAMKGDSFSNPERPLSKFLCNTQIEQRYLISSIENKHLQTRGDELKINSIKQCVNVSITNFTIAQETNKNIQIKRHNELVRFRIILLRDYLYLSFQEKKNPGRESAILKISNKSPLYEGFCTSFESLWDKYS